MANKNYVKNDPDVISDFERLCSYLLDMSIYLENKPQLKTNVFDNVLNNAVNNINSSVFNAIDEAKKKLMED